MEETPLAINQLLTNMGFSRLRRATREAVAAHLRTTGLSEPEISTQLETLDFDTEDPAPQQSQFYDYQKTGFLEYERDAAPVVIHLRDGTFWRRDGELSDDETQALIAAGLKNATFDFKLIFPTLH